MFPVDILSEERCGGMDFVLENNMCFALSFALSYLRQTFLGEQSNISHFQYFNKYVS